MNLPDDDKIILHQTNSQLNSQIKQKYAALKSRAVTCWTVNTNLQGKVRYTYSSSGMVNSEHIKLQGKVCYTYSSSGMLHVSWLVTTLDNSLCLWPITRIPIITFPAYAGTKLHCLVTEASVCEELNQSCIQSAAAGVNPEIYWLQVHMLTTTPPSHSHWVCHSLKHSWTSLPTAFSFFRPISQATLSLDRLLSPYRSSNLCERGHSFHLPDYDSLLIPPPPQGGRIKWCFCLTSVCLSDVCLSRTSCITREQKGLGRLKLAQR